MKIGLVKAGEPVGRVVWQSIPDMAKIVLLANKKFTIDVDDGLPRVSDELLATTLRDIEVALGLRS